MASWAGKALFGGGGGRNGIRTGEGLGPPFVGVLPTGGSIPAARRWAISGLPDAAGTGAELAGRGIGVWGSRRGIEDVD